MERNKQYEYRYIVFIDILGFKNLVEESSSNEDQLERIHRALKYISEIKQENAEGQLSLREQGEEITVFSDSIVISMPVLERNAGWYLLNKVIFIQMNLMSLGICIRGGMTVGELYHNDNIVFGPAMNEAYGLESNCAIYPRVIVDSKYLTIAYSNGNNPPEEEQRHFESYMVKQDRDGNYYVDFINQELNVDGIEEYIYLLEKAKQLIVMNLNRYNNKPQILMKYEWLKNYFNQTCESTGYTSYII
ncbi:MULTISPECIES: hypothetical protein [Bacillus]|uniref:hypothetical protein n=1 Tax=Bacillus TaxID=1386 RepID=UPI00110E4891|nr:MULTISPECIES: hypothetical protein [Bacillus]